MFNALEQERKIQELSELRSVLMTEIDQYFNAFNVPPASIQKAKNFITGTDSCNEVDLSDEFWSQDALSKKRKQELIDYASQVPGLDAKQVRLKICDRFAPRHYVKVSEFCDRYLEISLAQDEALEEHLESQRSEYRDPYEEYDENGCPSAEIQIHSDCIIVLAFEAGVGESLPKGFGRTYIGSQGNICWRFSSAAREALENMGYPIIKYPGVD